METLWINIKEYEGLYHISNLGYGKSLTYYSKHGRKNREKILKNGISSQGYPVINLYKNGKVKQFLISRLVAQAFLGLDINDSKMCVCHKDDNPLNNNVDNLFLGTHKENTKDMVSKQRGRFKNVYQFSKDGVFIKKWLSVNDASRELKLNASHISSCALKRKGRYSIGGFIWKYI